MEKYKMFKELGDGTCGRVYKAIDKETSEIVAVKKMKRKFYSWEDCVNLREVKSLRRLNHPNIIKLKEIIRENNELFFIFEYMEYNLYQIMRDRQNPFSEKEIRDFMYQVLQGLAHMHKNGYFHRDLKPENLLVTNQIIKMADFGLAREVSSMPPFTEYVSTRWYRAPEVLLQSPSYTPSIDMWAVGAILAELFTLCPIFPGESETDQLYKICCVLGKPDWNTFPGARNIFSLVNICYSEIVPPNLCDIIPNASPEAIDLIKQLCAWDPLKRPTAEECLRHPFFHVNRVSKAPPPHLFGDDPLQLKLNSMVGPTPDLELKLWDFGGTQPPDDCFLGLTLAINPSISYNLDKLSNSSVQDKSQSSVIWPLFSPDQNNYGGALESSLSLSFSSNHHNSSSVGVGVGVVPQTSGFSMGSSSSSSLRPNCMEHHHHPWLAMSSCSHFSAKLSPLKSNGDY